jgi:hypothetical protein
MRLTDGDALPVHGALKAEARKPPKARKPRQEAAAAPARQDAPFDDAVPF